LKSEDKYSLQLNEIKIWTLAYWTYRYGSWQTTRSRCYNPRAMPLCMTGCERLWQLLLKSCHEWFVAGTVFYYQRLSVLFYHGIVIPMSSAYIVGALTQLCLAIICI